LWVKPSHLSEAPVCFAPSGLSFMRLHPQGYGRFAPLPWAVLSRAFSAYL
jgi:hypothetical protein